MKYLLLGFAVLTLSFCLPVDATPFFNSKLGYNLSYKAYSGYEKIDWYFPEQTARMYYSLWQGVGDDIKDKSVPIIIWLQGGPGAASQFGCFNEVGPLYIHPDGKLQENGYSWSNRGHLVCVDQPVGVGFSYNRGKLVTDTYEASLHFTNFLHNFLSEWNFLENPLYISGESYAGHYIPSFARFLMANVSLGINLRGVMIGDGYLDPVNQMNFYDSMTYTAGISSLSAREQTTSVQNQALLNLFSGRYQ
jgi:carboxypeptidase C (cathepsin A)